MNKLLAALLLLPLASPSFAKAELSSRGEIKIENRQFENDKDSSTIDRGFGIATRLEVKRTDEGFIQRAQIFARVDDQDPNRNIVELEELYLGYLGETYEVKVGNQIFNWSAAEAFHPADILNSRNLDSNFENAEKLGETAVSFSWLLDSGTISIGYMPYFKLPKLPKSNNRLTYLPNTSTSITSEQVLKTDDTTITEKFNIPQYFFKLDWNFDSADISFHVVNHIDRSQPVISFTSATTITLTYLPVTQYGLTYQQTIGDFVLKSEVANRKFYQSSNTNLHKPDHTQLAFGLDYGWSGNSGSDSTVLLEYQTITNIEDKTVKANLSTFQNDILLGYRFAFNDTFSQEILITYITDLERDNESLSSLSYSRRITDTWALKSGVRIVNAPMKSTSPVGLEALDRANQFYFDLSRRF